MQDDDKDQESSRIRVSAVRNRREDPGDSRGRSEDVTIPPINNAAYDQSATLGQLDSCNDANAAAKTTELAQRTTQDAQSLGHVRSF